MEAVRVTDGDNAWTFPSVMAGRDSLRCLEEIHRFASERRQGEMANVRNLAARAKRSLILIDNWANTAVLDLFTKKRKGVRLTIFTSEHFKDGVSKHLISPADVRRIKKSAFHPAP